MMPMPVLDTRQHSPPVLALARQRRRLPRHAGLLRNHTQKTQNLVAQNARCSIVLQPTFRLRGKLGLAAASRHLGRTSARGQIPIALAALLPPTSRDFVPWRFSDAGHWSAWIVPPSPASENLHTGSRRRPNSDVQRNVDWE